MAGRETYLVQFVAGTRQLAQASLLAACPHAQISWSDESALTFEVSPALATAEALPFANNVFRVIARVRRTKLEASVRRLAERAWPARLPRVQGGFRVMAHIDGALVGMEPKAKSSLETVIARRTGARVVSRGSVQEFWVIGRSGWTDLVLAERLARKKRPKSKGALSAELCSMLVAASRPHRQDCFCDPFAGSGALAVARLSYPVKRIVCSDRNLDRSVLPRDLTRNARVELRTDDARHLTLSAGAVDAIVTDPPWGEHEAIEDYDAFAADVATELTRVLHPHNGRLVLLSGRRVHQSWQQALGAVGMAEGQDLSILVNGHPATVIIRHRHRQWPKQHPPPGSSGVVPDAKDPTVSTP